MTEFKDGPIDGVVVRALVRLVDARGWLCELFRADETECDATPAMGYVSESHPGTTRGPHEHASQTDRFCFLGPSDFLVVLWDNRPNSPTFRNRIRLVVGKSSPSVVIVPPGVVHGYRNIGDQAGLVVNLPNRLYKGQGRSEPVDEIRHEGDPHTCFRIDG
ncbi:MAG: dTDP-4-dehydrorhamnose 3,5-epimerase family protein [Polyangiaceae bacterium]|nr:dTDP-4-dehydrorhamnose 3,5-epimerase family protein [Polyangiaceae bacterium]